MTVTDQSLETQSGAPSHAPPPAPPRRIALLVGLALIGGLGFSSWLSSSGEPDGYDGFLRAPSTTISAARDATILDIVAEEGRQVKSGDTLLVLLDEQSAASLAEQQRRVAELQSKLERANAQADVELAWRSRELEAEIFETRLKSAELLREQFARKMEQLAWEDFLKRGPAVASSTTDDELFRTLLIGDEAPDETRIRAMLRQDAAANAAETIATQLELCEQRLDELLELRRGLAEKVRRSTGSELAALRLERANAELAQLEQQTKGQPVSSPSYGTVGVFSKAGGNRVAKGERLVELFDEDRRYVIARIPSANVVEFPVDTPVELVFPGEKRRKGAVTDISPQAKTPSGNAPGGETHVAVRIGPAGKLWPRVPIGARVRVVPAD